MNDIAVYLANLLESQQKGIEKNGNWFAKLKLFFNDKFGTDWKEFDMQYVVTKDELGAIMLSLNENCFFRQDLGLPRNPEP